LVDGRDVPGDSCCEADHAGVVTPPLTRSAPPPQRKPVMTTEELTCLLDESRPDG
jgi:hypothetical protein